LGGTAGLINQQGIKRELAVNITVPPLGEEEEREKRRCYAEK
jgi:hypothetical protein